MVDVVIQVLRRFDLLLVCRVSVQFSTVLIHLAAETGCQWCLSFLWSNHFNEWPLYIFEVEST